MSVLVIPLLAASALFLGILTIGFGNRDASVGRQESASMGVLSRGDDDREEEREDSSGRGSGSDREGNDDKEDNSGRGSSSSGSGSSGDQVKDDKDESVEVRTETRLPTGVRIRTREEEGRKRIDIYEGGKKLRFEIRDGRTVVKVENEENEIEDEEEFDEQEFRFNLDTAEGEEEVRIRARGDRFVVRERNIEAVSSFPLSVDLDTNELVVTTPAGVKRVAVLPQQAIDNMVRVGHIDVINAGGSEPEVSPGPSPTGSPEASPGVSPTTSPESTTTEPEIAGVELVEEDDQLVYRIDGAKRERLLGLFDVLIPRTVVVSAEDGQLVDTRQSIISRVLSALST